MRSLILLTVALLSSCSLVTTPVKVVGKTATTALDITGKTVGAGIGAISKSPSDQD